MIERQFGVKNMKKSLKITLGIFGLVGIGAIAIGSVVSCSNDSSNKTTTSSNTSKSTTKTTSSTSSKSNAVSYLPYSELSTANVINSPTNNKPYKQYQNALKNWTTIYDKLTQTKSQFENIIENAIYSYYKSSNGIFSTLEKDSQFPIGSTNYYFGISIAIKSTNITFSQNKSANINAIYDLIYYLVNANNIKQKYAIKEEVCNTTIDDETFKPILSQPFDIEGGLVFTSKDYYGAITVNTIKSIQTTTTLLENKAFASSTEPPLAQIMMNSSLIKTVIADESLPMQQVSKQTTTSSTIKNNINLGYILTYNNKTYNYGSEIQPSTPAIPNITIPTAPKSSF